MVVFTVVPKNSGLQKYRDIALSELNNSRVLEVRGEDVPFWVSLLLAKGNKTIGITGQDLYEEYCLKNKTNLDIIKKIIWNDDGALFNKPALCLLGPKNKELKDITKTPTIFISSKYKNLAENYLNSIGLKSNNIYVSGCVETGCSEGVADLIVDIVYSGSSMKKYGIKIYDVIMKSDMLIIGGDRND